MTWTAHADVYVAGIDGVNDLIRDGAAAGPATPYVTNTLTIMVPQGNPATSKHSPIFLDEACALSCQTRSRR